MDFHALQNKLFDLDPTDPREDFAKMQQIAQGGAAQATAQENVDYLKESAEVAEGSLSLDKDYSVDDFAKLAGVVSEGSAWDAFKTGYNNPTYSGIKQAAQGYSKGEKVPAKAAPKAAAPKQKAAPTARPGDWKGFLKQHTAQLKAIAADPKKKAEFDKFMAKMGEGVVYEEADDPIADLEARVANLEEMLSEKSVSKAQQQAAGIALAAKRKGETPKGDGAAAQMAKMSTKDLEDFAKTKHKGLPKKKTSETASIKDQLMQMLKDK
jgi:hypothetical protein